MVGSHDWGKLWWFFDFFSFLFPSRSLLRSLFVSGRSVGNVVGFLVGWTSCVFLG